MDNLENDKNREKEILENSEKLSENNPVEMNIEPPKDDLDVTGDKKIINEILKRNKVKIIVVAGVVLFVALIFVAILSTTEINKKPYYEQSCNNVTVIYDPYDGSKENTSKTFAIEDYVNMAVAEYTKNFINPPSGIFQVYYALAVSLRTEVIANNCTITYRDKEFNAAVPTDEIFTSAMTAAKGVVIANQEKKLIQAKTTDFCWKNQDSKEYMLYQANNMLVPSNFIDDNFGNEIYRDCPCNAPDDLKEKCWVKWEVREEDSEGNIIIHEEKEWLHYEEESGISVYGAYYLMFQYGFGYDQILRYFYGEKIMYMTIESSSTKDYVNIKNGNLNSSCNTSSDSSNLITFLNTFEGTGSFCDSGKGYVSYDLKDGTITIGSGVTNHVISSNYAKNYINSNNWQQYFHIESGKFYMTEGQCIPVEIIDQIEMLAIETNYASEIDGFAAKYGVTLTQYQKDAITSFNYNLGTKYTERLIQSYAENGYEGLWNIMKQYKNATINGVKQELDGLKKRRKAEFALFVTGDYSDQGLFYSRNLNNYDDYNSEGVMDRLAYCSMGTSGFALPLPKNSGLVCTSPYGYRALSESEINMGATSLHTGLDLGVSGGTNILAAKSGKVIEVLDGVTGSSPSTGNYVRIEHEDKTSTSYYHMKNKSIVVSIGDYVEQGEKIGEVGSTGASTGNHLHFTIYDVSGNTVDPYDYLDLSFLSDPSRCHLS